MPTRSSRKHHPPPRREQQEPVATTRGVNHLPAPMALQIPPLTRNQRHLRHPTHKSNQDLTVTPFTPQPHYPHHSLDLSGPARRSHLSNHIPALATAEQHSNSHRSNSCCTESARTRLRHRPSGPKDFADDSCAGSIEPCPDTAPGPLPDPPRASLSVRFAGNLTNVGGPPLGNCKTYASSRSLEDIGQIREINLARLPGYAVLPAVSIRGRQAFNQLVDDSALVRCEPLRQDTQPGVRLGVNRQLQSDPLPVLRKLLGCTGIIHVSCSLSAQCPCAYRVYHFPLSLSTVCAASYLPIMVITSTRLLLHTPCQRISSRRILLPQPRGAGRVHTLCGLQSRALTDKKCTGCAHTYPPVGPGPSLVSSRLTPLVHIFRATINPQMDASSLRRSLPSSGKCTANAHTL